MAIETDSTSQHLPKETFLIVQMEACPSSLKYLVFPEEILEVT